MTQIQTAPNFLTGARWPLGLPTVEGRQFQAGEDLADVLGDRVACLRHLTACVQRIAAGDVDPYRWPEWWRMAMRTGLMIEAAEAVGLGRQWVYGVAVRLSAC